MVTFAHGVRCALGVLLASWMGVASTVTTLAAAPSVGTDAQRATAYAVQLGRSLEAISDGRQQAPRDRWDPQYIVDTVGLDPGALYLWVHDNVQWVPYRGQLRGPVGVLMDRRGNALDQSLLLARLLSLAGLDVRLAHATLPDATVDRAWQTFAAIAAAAGPYVPAPLAAEPPAAIDGTAPSMPALAAAAPPAAAADSSPSGSLFGGAGTQSGSLFDAAPAPAEAPGTAADATALYDLDGAAANNALDAAADVHDNVVTALQARVSDQGNRLLAMFAPPGPSQLAAEEARDRAALADHWWVEVNTGGTWTDYDLLAPSAAPGKALAAASQTVSPDALPADMKQRVEIKVVAEQLINGQLHENTVFEHEIDPSTSIGKRITLRNVPMLWPADWDAITPDDVQEKLFAALYTQSEWMPSLSMDTDAFETSSIRDTGDVNSNPTPQSNPFLSLAFPAAGKVGRVTDLFDQLLDQSSDLGGSDPGTGELKPENAPRAEGELTAEWIDYTVVTPGAEPTTERREIFDILGPALRQGGDLSTFQVDEVKRLERAAGEMTETDIVVLPCWPASEFLADLTAQLALANKPVLDEFTRDPFGKTPPNSIELFSKLNGMPGPAYLYSMLRSQSERTAGSAFIDRPQIVTQHNILARVGPGELTSKGALDVVENGIGVDPYSGRDPFLVRLLQGVVDTNAEALAMPGAGDAMGDAFGAPARSGWTLLTSADKGQLATLGLPTDLTARLSADLDSGHAVVAPAAANGRPDVTGWWRVDPRTGKTLGIGDRGWGQDLVEYAFQLTIQAMMAHIACMAFTAAAEDKISKLTAEQGRDKIKTWARNCVSQALLETISGLSTSWIQSRFLDGAKVPTWNERAASHSPSPHGPAPHLPPTAPSGAHPESAPPSRPTPHVDEPPSTAPRTAAPPEAEPGPAPRAPNEPESGPAPRTQNEPEPAPHTPAEPEPATPNSNRPPEEEPSPNSQQHEPTPPEENADGGQRPDPFETETKNLPDSNCAADAGWLRVASISDDLLSIRSDATPRFLVAATGGCRPNVPNAPKPSDQTEVVDKVADATAAAKSAHQEEADAIKKYYDEPTRANQDAYAEAEQRSRAATNAEEEQWWKNGGKGVPPGTYDREPLPNPPAGWQPPTEAHPAAPKPIGIDPNAPPPAASPVPRGATPEMEGPPEPPAGGNGNRALPPSESTPPLSESSGPRPNQTQQMDNAPARPGDNGPAPNQTQQMENAPPRPPEGDLGTAKTQQAEPAPNQTQQMENAPARPGDNGPSPSETQRMGNAPPRPPEGDLGTAKTQQAEPAPNQTQQMENAPARPPEGDLGTAKTQQAQSAASPVEDPGMARTQPADSGPSGSNPQPAEGTTPGPGRNPDSIREAAESNSAAAKRLDDAYTNVDRNPTPANQEAVRQAQAESSAATRAEREAWSEATPEQRADTVKQYTDAREAAQRQYDQDESQYKSNPVADTEAALKKSYNDLNAARQAEIRAAAGAGTHIPPANSSAQAQPVAPPPMPVEQEGPPTPRPAEPGPSPNAKSVVNPPSPLQPAGEGPIDPISAGNRTQPMEGAPPLREGELGTAPTKALPAQPGPNQTQRMPDAPPRPGEALGTADTGLQPVQSGPPAAPGPATAPTENLPARPMTPEAIQSASDARAAAQRRFNDAQAAYAADPTAENRSALQQANGDYSNAERAEGSVVSQADAATRSEAVKPYTDARQAAQQRLDDAKLQYDANPTADTEAAWTEAEDSYRTARKSEMNMQSRSGLGVQPLPSPPRAPDSPPVSPAPGPSSPPAGGAPDLEGPPEAPVTALGTAPTEPIAAQPTAPRTQPMPVTPSAPNPSSTNQPAPGAPPRPGEDLGVADTTMQPAPAPQTPTVPRTPAERVAAVKPYTDVMIAAHNEEVDAANALLGNDTSEARTAYDRAVLAADQARKAEAGAWYKAGGAGFPPSKAPGVLEPLPEGIGQLPPIETAAAPASADGAPNSTLAMGLGSLVGTIQQGP